MTTRRILVTAALPYANGPIHLGHLVEYIQTDIWVRFQKLRGHSCIFICADDTHGTAIMIRARQEGRSEEALIADMREQHLRDFTGFDVAFDNYGSTNCVENRELCAQIWQSLREKGLIARRDVEQLFDPVAGTFLADRFVKGTCPKCKSPDQYGDSCEKCGETYTAADLIDPVSTLSGAKPEVRGAPHLFIELEKLHGFLEKWTQGGDHLQAEVANYLKGHFLGEPLRDWDVSRPAPYFGFEIPDAPGNFWYVWFDAPIGYIASTWEWCKKQLPPQKLDDWWKNPATEIHHFIGKDIQYFHTLFWPGMLHAAGLNLPAKVHIHGFLTVAGEKMSKRRGTFVLAATYLRFLDPSALRYYYASKLGSRLDDIDLNLDEFVDKVNADLVGKVVNLASRTARFGARAGLAAKYPEALDSDRLFQQGVEAGEAIAGYYDRREYHQAMRVIMQLAERANQFVDKHAPWQLAKKPEAAGLLQEVCTVALNLYRQIAIYLAPVAPRLAEGTEQLLGQKITAWSDAAQPLLGTPVAEFRHLLARVDRANVDAMISATKELFAMNLPESTGAAPSGGSPSEGTAPAAPIDGPETLAAEPLVGDLISIDDLMKVDLRIARVLTAEEVPEARKLLKLTLSLGGDVKRTVFAGIKAAYKPEQLVGRLVVMAANLQPRQMKFGLSEGMVLAVGPGGEEVFLLNADSGAKPGQRVH